MNINRNDRRNTEAQPETGHAEDTGSGMLGRRGVLGGLAAIPVLYSLGGAVSSAAAATASAAQTTALPTAGNPATKSNGLIQGKERRYNAPLLTTGTRLVLPAGIKVVPVENFYTRPQLASTTSKWPSLKAADGSVVDASVVPVPGAATRSAILSGFSEGWYELRHANGRAERVTWDAAELPFLWLHGEFGAGQHPYSEFFSLSLLPLSQDPFSRSTSLS